MTAPWPAEIRIRTADRCLEIEWDDGRRDMLPAELLRVESPSAEVQGHGAETKQIVAGKRSVTIVGAEPIGNYAVRLIFDDGHDSGLYTWATLRHFAENQAEIFATYLQALDSRGLKR
ncbi:gamma-butyrobetaine hydroxylase-like domain-containing protein [Zavarzinia sp.]|uniref:gamma-butyrobetaine hydroxylase-like domain-containing protein n=1 Tax=Zavarzinia sp. TaxID=2027920 RepID=UPI0035643F4A